MITTLYKALAVTTSMILTVHRVIPLNGINKLISVIQKCCVFFLIGTEFLNIIYISVGFKGPIKQKLDIIHSIWSQILISILIMEGRIQWNVCVNMGEGLL